MEWVWWFFAGSLGIAAIWAILGGKHQWKTLFSWSVTDPYSAEPGGTAYETRRIIATIALVCGVLILVFAALFAAAREPQDSLVATGSEKVWGSPQPLLVYRTIQSVNALDDSLVTVPIESYLPVNDAERAPLYLLELEPFSRLGNSNIPGLVGTEPAETDVTIGQADVVVNVRGPLMCIPRQVVAIETPERVQIAVQYGLPTPDDDSLPDNAAACPVGQGLTASVLIPLRLSDPIGERSVENLDGTPLTIVGSSD